MGHLLLLATTRSGLTQNQAWIMGSRIKAGWLNVGTWFKLETALVYSRKVYRFQLLAAFILLAREATQGIEHKGTVELLSAHRFFEEGSLSRRGLEGRKHIPLDANWTRKKHRDGC